MAATRPLRSPSTKNLNLTHSHALESLPRPSAIKFSKKKKSRSHGIRCDITSFDFDKPQNWADPIRVMHNSSPSSHLPSSVPMAARNSPPKNVKKVCLFYCAETKALAERVAAESDAIELRGITWR
jgi:hypothetical protein